MVMLLRAALRRNRPYRPIEAATVFQPSAADQVVALAEGFRAWLELHGSGCSGLAILAGLRLGLGPDSCAFASAALIGLASTTPYCRRRPSVPRRRIPDSVALAQVAGASLARALLDMQRQDAACLWLRGPPCSGSAPRGFVQSVFRAKRLLCDCSYAHCFGYAAIASGKRSSES